MAVEVTSYVGAMRPQRDAELAKVHAENARLRAEIARLTTFTLPDPLGPTPDFDTPIVDKFTCPGCHEELSAEDAADLCKICDDDPPLPNLEYADDAPLPGSVTE